MTYMIVRKESSNAIRQQPCLCNSRGGGRLARFLARGQGMDARHGWVAIPEVPEWQVPVRAGANPLRDKVCRLRPVHEQGWIKWRDGQPDERRFVPMGSACLAQTVRRWATTTRRRGRTTTTGVPRDPWQPNIELPCASLKASSAR